MTRVLIRTVEDTKRHRETQREDSPGKMEVDRDWNDVATSQGTSGVTRS